MLIFASMHSLLEMKMYTNSVYQTIFAPSNIFHKASAIKAVGYVDTNCMVCISEWTGMLEYCYTKVSADAALNMVNAGTVFVETRGKAAVAEGGKILGAVVVNMDDLLTDLDNRY